MATTVTDERNTNVTPPASACCKKSLFKRILFVLLALIGVLLVVIAIQPSDFRVSRSATMAAPQAAVFEQVNDFHKWEAWSPWAKMDPNAKNTFEGPTSGVGSIIRWDGNSDVGAGSMTILESEPNERVQLKLDFIRPFEGTSDVEFTFKPEVDQTAVTWSMAGKNNFMAKAIGLVMDCEKMVGEQFDKGLASMKSIVEKSPSN
jgi:uncharacterized protein YndB with AHSA1/START domain